jgi:hypothetical protein
MSFFVTAPFSDGQLKSINTYQREERFVPLRCKCGGKLYGRHDGMVCPTCFNVDVTCPRWISNWTWNKFSGKRENDVDGIVE